MFRLKTVERYARSSHGLLHVFAGGIYPFAKYVRLAVEKLVKDGDSHIGHTQVVEIRITQCNADSSSDPFFEDAIPLAAGISGRSGYLIEYFLKILQMLFLVVIASVSEAIRIT